MTPQEPGGLDAEAGAFMFEGDEPAEYVEEAAQMRLADVRVASASRRHRLDTRGAGGFEQRRTQQDDTGRRSW